MEADGLEEIEAGGGGTADAGDYYGAGDTFGPSTTPSSQRYDGSVSNVRVSSFSSAGPQMSATFEIIGTTPPSVSGCSLCYTCGGDWPAFSGVIPTRQGKKPYERGSACSGSLAPANDVPPYLCCTVSP